MAFLGTTQPQNLAGYYDTCTMGGVTLNVTGSAVYNVPYPCSGGTLPGGTETFTMNSCDSNLVTWQNYAESYVTATLGVRSLASFAHRWLIAITQWGCNWDGHHARVHGSP